MYVGQSGLSLSFSLDACNDELGKRLNLRYVSIVLLATLDLYQREARLTAQTAKPVILFSLVDRPA